ncbi:MAG: NAD(P)H-dependent oxidoreductase [Pirellulaceae bacterium]
MTHPKILAFAGSARKDSFNAKLVRIAASGARAAGTEVTILDLREFPLPLFDQDLEAENGTPENATKLKRAFMEHDGLLLACPEYNSSITPLLKNTIDWVSRAEEGESPLAAYRGKVAALMAASPGALGGLRGLVHVRSILSSIGVIVLPDQIAVPRAFEAFDSDGRMTDEKRQASVERLGRNVADMLVKLVD